ncbi:MAG: shikimate kinase [Parasphingorhabdus sp.]
MSIQNLILVGPMGVGKTTVGKALAKVTGREFVDLDQEIEYRTGVSIPTIFDIEGEDGFRKRETEIIQEYTDKSNLVIATGGGAVGRSENRKAITRSALVIYLKAPVEVLIQRTRNNRNRPLLNDRDPASTLINLMEEREPLYQEVADIVIEVDDRAPGSLCKRIVKQIEEIT